jgi:hypothetical protein
MSYKVDRFNGTFLVNVSDGSIDTTTDLRFIGKNYAGYGEIQNENFLHLMENFANTAPPPKAQIGQIWYDTTATVKKLKFWDGSQWKVASGALPRSTPPSGLTAGDFWFNTVSNQINVWTGTEFVLIGPENTPEIESTAIQSASISDISNTQYSVLRVNISGQTVAIISQFEFTPLTPIAGFTKIRKGLTLRDSIDNGTSADFRYWGTATVAEKLLGPGGTVFSINNLVTQAQKETFQDNGIFVGQNGILRIFIENGDVPVFENQNFTDLNNSLVFRIKTDGAGGKFDPLIVSRTSVFPGTNNTFDLGRSVNKWKDVYASQFFGNLTGNVTGNTTGIHKGNLLDATDTIRFDAATATFFGIFGTTSSPGSFTGIFNGDLNGTAASATTIAGLSSSELAIPNTIAIRTSTGDLVANRFLGIASRADELLVGSVYRSASLGQTANTIAARDNNADITARIFNGTATSAQYADLAEKYLPDAEYDVGTVVSVGGEKEITASIYGDRALGVISANPAFMMNKDLEGGVYVALKGRVPVKVSGEVRKGQRLVAHNNGAAVAEVSNNKADVFAIALETNLDPGIKVVEAVVL